jgi:hypothetical protein
LAIAHKNHEAQEIADKAHAFAHILQFYHWSRLSKTHLVL